MFWLGVVVGILAGLIFVHWFFEKIEEWAAGDEDPLLTKEELETLRKRARERANIKPTL